MLVDKFMRFLKKQDPPFPCGIYTRGTKDRLECDGGEIEVQKLEIFLQKIYRQGQEDMFRDPWDKKFREMVENYYKE